MSAASSPGGRVYSNILRIESMTVPEGNGPIPQNTYLVRDGTWNNTGGLPLINVRSDGQSF